MVIRTKKDTKEIRKRQKNGRMKGGMMEMGETEGSKTGVKVLRIVMYAPHNDVSVNDVPRI
jgi:hypothetical protein